MIRLTKQPEPQILAENSASWTAVLREKIAAGLKPTDAEKTRYRHREVKAALENETSDKCAYCESKLKHIHHGDVEHIFPKSLDPSRQFEWDNLTLACEICNQNKSNRDPYLENIIDPYQVDPNEYIQFLGSMALSLGNTKGTSTIAILGLNRAQLIERRQETFSRLVGIAEMAFREDLPIEARRAIFQDMAITETRNGVQYSAMAKSLVSSLQGKFDAMVDKNRLENAAGAQGA